MDNMQEIEDYLMNNEATISVESFICLDDGIEYVGRIQSDDLSCVVSSSSSFLDVLSQLSISLMNANTSK